MSEMLKLLCIPQKASHKAFVAKPPTEKLLLPNTQSCINYSLHACMAILRITCESLILNHCLLALTNAV